MKKQVLCALTLLSLLVALVMPGYANPGRMTINIPFDFNVGKATLPAGQYTVGRLKGIESTLAIRGEDNKASVSAITYHGSSSKMGPSKAKLVFNRYGDRYFLAQVWEEGSTTARQLTKSRAERELMKSAQSRFAKNVEPETITVTAQ